MFEITEILKYGDRFRFKLKEIGTGKITSTTLLSDDIM